MATDLTMDVKHADEGPAVTATAVPRVSIVVVSWNCRDILKYCLDSIAASTLPASDIQTIVVDNASADGTAQLVADDYPWVELVAQPVNLGFAGGNNLGFEQARAPCVLLLNPDAYFPQPDTLERLLKCLDDRPDVAALGCQLTYPDGIHQVGDAGYRPSGSAVAAYALGLTQLLRMQGLFVVRPDALAGQPVDVDWICGACFLVRREVIDDVGGLDESLFMYAEDVEWGCRIREHGHRILYVPDITVVHIQGGTQYKTPDAPPSTKWLDSLAKVYAVMNQGRQWWLFRFSMALGFAMRAVAYRAMAQWKGRQSYRNKAEAMDVFARHVWNLREAP
jgi:N-acetylglucosaminyl-diphospho-decaprenol L-rhamnosyltransferase